MFEVLERRRVRVSCLDEHVTLLTAGALYALGSFAVRTLVLVRLSVSATCGHSRRSSWPWYPDVDCSWKTVYLSLPLDPTEDVFGLVSFLGDLLTHFFLFRATSSKSRACIVFAKHA